MGPVERMVRRRVLCTPVPKHPFPLVGVVVPAPVGLNPFGLSDWPNRLHVLHPINRLWWFGWVNLFDYHVLVLPENNKFAAHQAPKAFKCLA